MEKLTENYLLELVKYVLRSEENYNTLAPHLNINHVADENVRLLLDTIIRFKKTKNKLPKISYLELSFKRDKKILEVINKIIALDEPDEESVLTGFEEFTKRVRFIQSYETIGNLFSTGKKTAAYKEFNKAAEQITNFSLRRNRVDKIFQDFEERVIIKNLGKMTDQKEFLIPTEIDELNMFVDGYQNTDYVLWMGDSGVGKSTMLIGQGVHAARFGFNSLHVTAEGSRMQTLNRYDACWTGNQYRDVKANEWDEEKYKRYLKALRGMSGEIFVEAIEQFNHRPTIAGIRALLYNFRKQGIRIHQVLVDYLELFQPMFDDYDTEEQRQAAVSRDLKDIALEFNCIVVSVTQAQRINREFLDNPDFVIERDKIGESYSKIKPCDFFITINQTRDEYKAHKARVFIDKAREHGSRHIMRIYQSLPRSRFYDRRKTINGFVVKNLKP